MAKASKPKATQQAKNKPAAKKKSAKGKKRAAQGKVDHSTKVENPTSKGRNRKKHPAGRDPIFTMEKVDGRELRVARWTGPKKSKHLPVLFFNGIGANIEAMAPLADLLDDRDFITFDMPGVGGSPDPVLPYNAVLMARVSALLLDRFDMPVVDVMGVSWGGAMAQQFVLQCPGRVGRVILKATTAGMMMIPGNPAALSKMADPRRYIDPEFMNKHFKTLYGGETAGKQGHIGRITPPSPRGYFYQLLAMLGWTSAPFLPFMKKETLIMMGDKDQIVPIANGHFLKMLIPNSRLYVVKGGGHLFMLSHVDEAVEEIRSFLDEGDTEEIRQAA